MFSARIQLGSSRQRVMLLEEEVCRRLAERKMHRHELEACRRERHEEAASYEAELERLRMEVRAKEEKVNAVMQENAALRKQLQAHQALLAQSCQDHDGSACHATELDSQAAEKTCTQDAPMAEDAAAKIHALQASTAKIHALPACKDTTRDLPPLSTRSSSSSPDSEVLVAACAPVKTSCTSTAEGTDGSPLQPATPVEAEQELDKESAAAPLSLYGRFKLQQQQQQSCGPKGSKQPCSYEELYDALLGDKKKRADHVPGSIPLQLPGTL